MNDVDGELKVFAPILIQQYVRMQTAAHYISSDGNEKKTKFRISPENYKKMTDEPLQAMLIGLELEYDKGKEILTVCPDAEFISIVEKIDDKIINMGKAETGSSIGTGGMNTKIHAAQIVTKSGADMIIANSDDIHILHRIMDGRDFGTLFVADKDDNFELVDFVAKLSEE